ncbi:HlyD family efflux transporter periplasmic adaptor subunit [Roseivivax isoporae]|uniref:Curdlan synthesis protein n=1 Tax=Roseivivax isoporae LMG 25204 TaxID=1449351 RepID=X7F2Z7_9RHOB|nr:HlyD family secretion protein [Roseivivax isoporae]ETX26466.1 Curdlan synthesis protein [Roseivivax isoporae LMG 25204]
MKYTRLIIGLVAIVVALWVIVGEQMTGASANAVLNARVVTLRSDVAGTLEMPERALGAGVQEGEVVATVTDPLVDRMRLDDLLMELAFEQAEAERLGSALEDTKAIRAALSDRAERYRTERIAELRTRLERARNRLAILEEGGVPEGEEAQRRVDAVDQTTPDRLPAEPLVTELVLEHARERVETLEIALRSAEAGVFLGDGYNDSPNAEQRATQLESEIAALEAAAAEAAARVAAVETRIGREQVHVNGLTGGEIMSPVTGRFWEVLEADGVTVQRGDPILRIVDCASTIVTLSVPQQVYNDLQVGDAATFRFENQSRVFDATVSRLAGSGAATIYEHLAVAPSQKHLERYDVTLLVPELTADPDLGCAIGRTGRAFFDTRPLDWLRGLWS